MVPQTLVPHMPVNKLIGIPCTALFTNSFVDLILTDILDYAVFVILGSIFAASVRNYFVHNTFCVFVMSTNRDRILVQIYYYIYKHITYYIKTHGRVSAAKKAV